MKRTIVSLVVCLCCCSAWCQSDDSQVLVFRNSGEVNLFYEAEIDSMIMSKTDTAGTEHEDYVSQVFYTKDTTMVIPIAEIDSVAFGSRNVVEYKPGVIVIDEQHRSYITAYEVSTMTYGSGTPSETLPEVGNILYCYIFDDMFPAGLAARVTSIAQNADGTTTVALEKVDVAEVFNRLFYAGDGNNASARSMLQGLRNAPPEPEVTTKAFEHSLEIGDIATVDVNGPVSFTHKFVVNPLKHYYHADFNVDATLTFDLAIHTVQSAYNYETEALLTIPLPLVAFVLQPRITVPVFFDLTGQVNGNLSTTRNFNFGWSWTRQNGEDTAGDTTPEGDESKNKTLSNTTSLTVDGEVFLGTSIDFELGLVGQLGVIGKAKVGPCFKSKFGLGVVQELATSTDENDRYEAWGSASLSMCTRVAIEACIFNRENLIWGPINESRFWGPLNLDFSNTKLDFLPLFKSPCAVAYPKVTATEQKQEVSVAVKDAGKLLATPDVGFEAEDENGNILDSTFVEPTPQTAEKDVRAYTTVMEVGTISEAIKVVPIVHYAGYTLRHIPIVPQRYGTIQPIVSYGSNGATTFISGSPIIGQATDSATTYISGNYLPVPNIDTMYVAKRTITTSYYISTEEELNKLIGTWTDGDNATLTFIDLETGTYANGTESKPFDWAIDDPQTGDITLYFGDGTSRVYAVLQFNGTELKLMDKRTKETLLLSKK